MLSELRALERLAADSADKVLGMPGLVEGADVLALDGLIAVTALGTSNKTFVNSDEESVPKPT